MSDKPGQSTLNSSDKKEWPATRLRNAEAGPSGHQTYREPPSNVAEAAYAEFQSAPLSLGPPVLECTSITKQKGTVASERVRAKQPSTNTTQAKDLTDTYTVQAPAEPDYTYFIGSKKFPRNRLFVVYNDSIQQQGLNDFLDIVQPHNKQCTLGPESSYDKFTESDCTRCKDTHPKYGKQRIINSVNDPIVSRAFFIDDNNQGHLISVHNRPNRLCFEVKVSSFPNTEGEPEVSSAELPYSHPRIAKEDYAVLKSEHLASLFEGMVNDGLTHDGNPAIYRSLPDMPPDDPFEATYSIKYDSKAENRCTYNKREAKMILRQEIMAATGQCSRSPEATDTMKRFLCIASASDLASELAEGREQAIRYRSTLKSQNLSDTEDSSALTALPQPSGTDMPNSSHSETQNPDPELPPLVIKSKL